MTKYQWGRTEIKAVQCEEKEHGELNGGATTLLKGRKRGEEREWCPQDGTPPSQSCNPGTERAKELSAPKAAVYANRIQGGSLVPVLAGSSGGIGHVVLALQLGWIQT